jgi:glutamate synthase (NADPH/NADH) large chain
LLACSYIHHSLKILKVRSRFGILIESAEPREPHHFALLFGYGASAINPYMVNEIIHDQVNQGFITNINADYAIKNYNKATAKGILKIMNKIGISTLHSYRAAQIFEILGLNKTFSSKYFPNTPSRRDTKKHFQIRKLPIYYRLKLAVFIAGEERVKNTCSTQQLLLNFNKLFG